jgi:predicted nucleotide-binding protein
MQKHETLNKIALECERISREVERIEIKRTIDCVHDAVRLIGRSASGSWLGHQADAYYTNFEEPPPDDQFSMEWGFQGGWHGWHGSSARWQPMSRDDVESAVMKLAGDPDLDSLETRSNEICERLLKLQSQVVAILSALFDQSRSASIEELRDQAKKLLVPITASDVIEELRPKGSIISRDMEAISQGQRTPPHTFLAARVAAVRANFDQIGALGRIANAAVMYLHHSAVSVRKSTPSAGKVFIGHGRSTQWRELSTFIQDRLKLPWDEFNREPTAGLSVSERLQNMLEHASFALLVMTAEDQHTDDTLHARENVIHETGLFQGCLGFKRAIVLLEDGCQEFSNIHGLVQIRYPSNCIKACFEEVRGVLEREAVLINK